MTSENNAYKQAGVNIQAGNDLVQTIKPLAKSTTRLGADTGLGGFGALFDLKKCGFKDPILVSATDGVGTKLKIAIDTGIHNTIGIDLVAMCVNDLIVQGAEPLFFLDYFATGKLSIEVAAKVIEGIADGCRQAGCALVGGETAEMPGMYHDNDYDLAGFSVGAVERDAILPKKNIKVGDVVLGLASSGVHSNGFSLVRHILKNNNLSFNDKAPFSDKTLAEELLTPTKIYVKPLLSVIKSSKIKALAHITGGGLLENIPRILTDEVSVTLDKNSWQRPEIFNWLQSAGNLTDHDMHLTFNSGIGMVIIASAEDADYIENYFKETEETCYRIGEVTTRTDAQVIVK